MFRPTVPTTPVNTRASWLFLIGLALLLSLPGQCQEPTYSQKLYGNWYTYPLGNPNTDSVRHQFRHDPANDRDEIVVTRQCLAESRVVTAKAVSPIEVSEDQIRILKSAYDVQPTQGTSTCEAAINAAVFSYSFSEDGHLVLTNPGGNPDYLELAREAEGTAAAVPQRLYGTWLLPPFEGKAMQVQVRWVFYTTAERQDRLRQITVCHKGNDSLVSHVDSDISISGESIKILQSASHQEVAGAFSCEASVTATTWRYTLAPGGMTVTMSAGGTKPITLTREPQAGLN